MLTEFLLKNNTDFIKTLHINLILKILYVIMFYSIILYIVFHIYDTAYTFCGINNIKPSRTKEWN